MASSAKLGLLLNLIGRVEYGIKKEIMSFFYIKNGVVPDIYNKTAITGLGKRWLLWSEKTCGIGWTLNHDTTCYRKNKLYLRFYFTNFFNCILTPSNFLIEAKHVDGNVYSATVDLYNYKRPSFYYRDMVIFFNCNDLWDDDENYWCENYSLSDMAQDFSNCKPSDIEYIRMRFRETEI